MSTELLLPQVTMPGLTFREWQTGDALALARYMTRPEYNRWLAVKLQSVAEVDVILKPPSGPAEKHRSAPFQTVRD